MAMTNDANVLLAKILGAVFVLVGLLGFVWDPLLGVFGVNPLHNIVHLLSGVILLAVAYINNGEYARVTNQIFGVVYLLLAVLGFAQVDFLVNLFAMDEPGASLLADNALHLLLGIVHAGVGFGVKSTAPRTTRV